MFGLAIKLALVAVLGFAVFTFAPGQVKNLSLGSNISLPSKFDAQSIGDSLKNIDFGNLGQKFSQSLDNLVTRTSNSPVVLGIEITDESLKTITDTLRGLPPDQFQLVKEYLCQPATASAK